LKGKPLPTDIASIWAELGRLEQRLSFGNGLHVAYDSLGREKRANHYGHWGNFDEQLSRVERVRRALFDSGEAAKRIVVGRLAGIDLSSIWSILIEACKDIALIYGGTIAAGATVGAAGGAFLGGVGAFPGAAAGVAAGTQVGTWIMALLGLKSVVDELQMSVPDAVNYYERGFRIAWGPTWREQQLRAQTVGGLSDGDVRQAAFEFANGHVILVGAILTALTAYVSRGRGDKAAVLREIRGSSRLGPKVARWIEENEKTLIAHPALQSRRNNVVGSENASVMAGGKRQRPAEEGEQSLPKGMPLKGVPCFKANDLPSGKIPEFDRQLAGQETGLNRMTVEEYLEGRDAFKNKISVRDPQIARNARIDHEQVLIERFAEKFLDEGMHIDEAEARAKQLAAQKMETLAALHNPDMVSAGKDVIADFGDRNVNSRIGAQWRTRVSELDAAANKVPEAMRSKVNMNVKLKRC
jgi:hypothetical protein